MFHELHSQMGADQNARNAAARELQPIPASIEREKVKLIGGVRWSPKWQKLADMLGGKDINEDFGALGA